MVVGGMRARVCRASFDSKRGLVRFRGFETLRQFFMKPTANNVRCTVTHLGTHARASCSSTLLPHPRRSRTPMRGTWP